MTTKEFDAAAEQVKNLKSRPTDLELLEVYALFKQATVGDVNVEKPGIFDLKGRAKWEHWNTKKGLSKEEAIKQYIAKAQELVKTYGLN